MHVNPLAVPDAFQFGGELAPADISCAATDAKKKEYEKTTS